MHRQTITICGSLTRAADAMNLIAWHLKAAGHIVYQPTPKPANVTHMTDLQRRRITEGHLAAIRRSSLVILVVPDSYMGDATRAEMDHAEQHQIPTQLVVDVEEFLADLADGLYDIEASQAQHATHR